MPQSVATPVPGTLSLERLPQVQARTQLSRSEIYRRIAAGRFPSPIKLGSNITAWDSREVDLWIQARIAEHRSREIL